MPGSVLLGVDSEGGRMLKQSRRPGRPQKDDKKSPAENQRKYRQRKAQADIRVMSFNVDSLSELALSELMEANGFDKKEQSEFLCALVLQLTGRTYYGKKIILPSVGG
jgi:hypothetical protein